MIGKDWSDQTMLSEGDIVIVKKIPSWPGNCRWNPQLNRFIIKDELFEMIGQMVEVHEAISFNNITVKYNNLIASVGVEDLELLFSK